MRDFLQRMKGRCGMSERYCIACGKQLEVVKNGFMFAVNNPHGMMDLHTSDLWGCSVCKRFQIHGCPGVTMNLPFVSGDFLEDPGNDEYIAMLDPVISGFSDDFNEHMVKYYSHWNWNWKE